MRTVNHHGCSWLLLAALGSTALPVMGCSGGVGDWGDPVNGGGSGGGSNGGRDPDGINPEDLSCKKVDVVIVVDNSDSMGEERDALVDEVFPGFAAALMDVGQGLDDFRVGVADACPWPASLHTRGTGGACSFASRQAWMESADTELAAEFACVGAIDESDKQCTGDNDDEQPVSAAAAILEASAAGTANAGFLRSDALLVVVAITDEDERPVPAATAQQIYDRLVATKGSVERIVFLGIGGAARCEGAYGLAEDATTMKAVTQKFVDVGHGVFWDLCAGDLGDGLAAAMATIDSACEDLPEID